MPDKNITEEQGTKPKKGSKKKETVPEQKTETEKKAGKKKGNDVKVKEESQSGKAKGEQNGKATVTTTSGKKPVKPKAETKGKQK